MMESLRQYIMSVVAAAILCGMVMSLFKKGRGKEIVNLLCGLMMAITVVRPIADIEFTALHGFGLNYLDDARSAAALGDNLSRETLRTIIKEETEAYILDKAADVYADVTVEVVVSAEEIPLPVSVCISGDISPYARGQLTRFVQEDLGIAKENQLWIG